MLCPTHLLIAMATVLMSAPASASERVEIGHLKSRGLLSLIPHTEKAPLVILIPGAGPNGPEEMMSADTTVDGQEHALFSDIAHALNLGGVHTLQLGKPGIEFFSGWDPKSWYYDRDLYRRLRWQDLLDNVSEALAFARTLPEVDPGRVYILGHSEGTRIAVEAAAKDSTIAGVLLLGYSGDDIEARANWQLFRRDIEHFVATDVDENHDGYVDRAESARWPEFEWAWAEGVNQVSYAEIESSMRTDPSRTAVIDYIHRSPLYSDAAYHRGPIHSQTAGLSQPVWIFTGALDLQTPATEAETAREACAAVAKQNCFVTIVPGVGHAFSAPRGPRAHPLLDMTLGPVSGEFLEVLSKTAEHVELQRKLISSAPTSANPSDTGPN